MAEHKISRRLLSLPTTARSRDLTACVEANENIRVVGGCIITTKIGLGIVDAPVSLPVRALRAVRVRASSPEPEQVGPLKVSSWWYTGPARSKMRVCGFDDRAVGSVLIWLWLRCWEDCSVMSGCDDCGG